MIHNNDSLSADDLRLQYDRAIKLLEEILETSKSKQSTMISPISIDMVLMMLANVTDKQATKAIEEYFGVPVESINEMALSQIKRLMSLDSFRIANSLWLREIENGTKFTMKQDILDKLRTYYRVNPMKFSNTFKPINDWVKESTNGKIQKILDDSTLGIDTNSVVANAVYFKSNWIEELRPIGEKWFINGKKEKSKKEFMGLTSTHLTYMEDADCQSVSMGYRDGSSMVIFLPKNETSNFKPDLNTIRDLSSGYRVNIEMPKFESEFDANLAEIADRLGILDIFREGALDKIVEQTKSTLSEVKHKTYIKVDEHGTEAAAVTAGVMRCAALCVRNYIDVKVVLDRPFYYGIISQYGDILFIGKYKG